MIEYKCDFCGKVLRECADNKIGRGDRKTIYYMLSVTGGKIAKGYKVRVCDNYLKIYFCEACLEEILHTNGFLDNKKVIVKTVHQLHLFDVIPAKLIPIEPDEDKEILKHNAMEFIEHLPEKTLEKATEIRKKMEALPREKQTELLKKLDDFCLTELDKIEQDNG